MTQIPETPHQIKDYLNEQFMRDKVTAREFIDTMFSVVDRGTVGAWGTSGVSSATRVLAISLGHLMHSSMMTSAHTHNIISEGTGNRKTQEVLNSLTPSDMAKFRNLIGSPQPPNYVHEAYWMSLTHAPRLAGAEDVKLLSTQLKGEEPTETTKWMGINKPSYHPLNLLFTTVAATAVVRDHPELVTETAIAAVCDLPRLIGEGEAIIRPSFDRHMEPGQLEASAVKLLKTLEENSGAYRPFVTVRMMAPDFRNLNKLVN